MCTRQAFPVWLLAGAMFDDVNVAAAVITLWRQHTPVTLLGQSSGPIRGKDGFLLQPDVTLAQMTCGTAAASRLLLVAGGEACAAALLLDPRVHQLVHRILGQGGAVALMRGTRQVALETGLIQAHPTGLFLCQEKWMDAAAFVHHLITYLT
ncbi:MAG: DJ-1/PfpI family protein [Chloroflexi bacterium]|nr:DJ-1/PfpI family protein [Chloroflexota bacterium]MBP8055738.1 DJ-1/PfpI family protein [Chloroflexota bacterium]